MPLSQNDAGRAYEYAIALNLAERLPASIADNNQLTKAKKCFDLCSPPEQTNILKSAREAVYFLVANDSRLSDTNCVITIQPDQKGITGDVRDIVVTNMSLKQQIGISAKHRHEAVKHSRLSETIDFGTDWLGFRCSDAYFHEVTPIFRELRSRKRRGELWRDIPDKHQRFYLPILEAFAKEMQRLFAANPNTVAAALVKYLLGRNDFYKVTKINGTTSIQSFNIAGSLFWGPRIPMPTRIIEISSKPKSTTTIFITFDKGWQLSFRIHNASEIVEPSLKFDINIVGLPPTIARNVIGHLG